MLLCARNLPTKVCLVKAMVFSVIMYRYESWTIKKAEHGRTDAFKLWCWRRVLSHLNYKEIKPVNPKRNQSWIFFGRTVAEAEAPIIWPPNAKSQLTGKDWCWERLRAGGGGDDRKWDGWMASMTWWTWVWGDSEGQGSLVCCSPWVTKSRT